MFAQTAGPSLDPETLQAGLERFHAVAERTCGRHRGRVVELRGDAVVAVFGIPVAREDDAQRAIAAAAELVAAARLPFGLGVRCGACTGEVLAAGDGHVVGEAIAVAERLGRAADCGEVRLADADVARRRARRPRVRPPGRRAGGCAGSTPTRPRSAAGTTGRSSAASASSSCCGRRSRASRAAAPRRSSPCSASPGSASRGSWPSCAGVAGTVLTGHCPARGQGVSLWPLREAVVQACGDRTWEELAADLAIPPAAALRVAAAVGLAEEDAGGTSSGRSATCSARSRGSGRWCSSSTTRTAPSPRCSTCSPPCWHALEDVPVLLVWVARADEPAGRPAGGTELVLHRALPRRERGR